MRAITGFWRKKKAWPAGAVQAAVGILAQGISTLDDEPRDNPMKRQAIEEFQSDQIQKTFDMAWGVVGKKSKFNVSQWCGDHGFGVFLLKLKRRWFWHREGTVPSVRKGHQPFGAFLQKWKKKS